MKIILCGGGSGGHFYPLIAVTESIRDIVHEKKLLQAKIYYLAPNPYNAGVLFDHEIEFKKIYAGKVRRYFSIKNFFDMVKSFFGFIQTFFKVFFIYPDVIFSKGGFMSLPVVFAGKLLGIPIIIHESDSVPGRANMLAGKYAKEIAVSFAEAESYFPKEKVFWTGHPIRKDIMKASKEGAKEYLGLNNDLPVVVIFGGSLGAKKINDTIIDSLPELIKKYQVIHQTGKLNFEEVSKLSTIVLENSEYKDRYKIFDYLNSVALRMCAGIADVIISRGGSTLFEISVWGVPSIIIPITDSNGDHQRKNAYNYARTGASIVIEEDNLTPEILQTEINDIITNKERNEYMREGTKKFAKNDAAQKIAEEIIKIALSHEE